MTQNVVTYTVVVTTENKDEMLPYMTANLQFEIERHENVLKVPNAALRWKPRPKQIAPDVRAETLAAMNRRDDKSKRGTEKQGREPRKDTRGSSPRRHRFPACVMSPPPLARGLPPGMQAGWQERSMEGPH